MIFGRAENIRILGYLSGFGGAGIGGEFPLPLSFNTMQYFPSAHPRFSSRRNVASASPRLLAMARTLGCLRPSGMFQDFSMRKRSSSVRCDLDLLHFMSSAFLCGFVVSFTVSQKADIFISFFGLARRPPGGGLRGAFFALLDASLHISFFGLARRPPGGGLRGAFFALLDASLHFASIEIDEEPK